MQLPALQARGIDLPGISQAAARVRGTNALTSYREAATSSIPQENRLKLLANIRKMSAEDRAKSDHASEQIARSVAYIEGLPEMARPGAYRQEIERLTAAGIDTSQIPRDYSPDVLARAKAMTTDLNKLFEEADAGGYTDLADPEEQGFPKGSVVDVGPKGKRTVVYKPGGGKKGGASVMERLRWMYAFGVDPETGKKLDEETQAKAGKALAPGSADTPDEFERNIYAILMRGFTTHDKAREAAREARESFYPEKTPTPARAPAAAGSGSLVPPAGGAEPRGAQAFSGPLPPDIPIQQMSVEQAQDFLQAGGDAIAEEDLRALRDRLRQLLNG